MVKVYIILVLLGAAGLTKCQTSNDVSTPIQNILKNTDNTTNIEEPCKDTTDFAQCIRDFFQRHARCSVVLDVKREPETIRGRFSVDVAISNATMVFVNPVVVNLLGEPEKFYINKNTGNLIFSVRYTNFTVNSKKAEFIVHKRSEEPKVIVDRIKMGYPFFVTTAVIPAGKNIANDDRRNRINNWVLQKALINTYYPFPHTTLKFGSKITESSDPEVQESLQTINNQSHAMSAEIALNGAKIVFMNYLQKYICNFGMTSQ